MEDELLTGSSSAPSFKKKQSVSYTEIMEAHLPVYLEMGMTYEQYWDGDVEMVIGYRKAQERRREWQNQVLWLQGLYFYNALTAVMPALSIKSKDTSIKPYIEEPIPITKTAVKEKQEREEKERFDKNLAHMKALAMGINARMQRKGGEIKHGTV